MTTKLTPREPTKEMIDAGLDVSDSRRRIWVAMHDAAPPDDTIERLTRERDEALKDAARYAWLRHVHDRHFFVTRYVGGAVIPRFDGTVLDAAIDAAMEAAA